MYFKLSLVLAVAALCAQFPDQNTQLLLDHAKADRDLFGRGGTITLEDQLNMAGGSCLRLSMIEDRMLYADNGNPQMLGTPEGAEMFLDRQLKESDIVVTGKIVQQISILNTTRTKIVTDSLLIVDDVLHAKPEFNVQPGSSVVIARPGGRMHINQGEVVEQQSDFAEFAVGRAYLVFLHRNGRPNAESYGLEPDDAFLLDEKDSFWSLNTKRLHPAAAYLGNGISFLQRIRDKAAEVNQ